MNTLFNSLQPNSLRNRTGNLLMRMREISEKQRNSIQATATLTCGPMPFCVEYFTAALTPRVRISLPISGRASERGRR